MVVSDEALRPFRSRRGRLVATVMAVVSLVVFGAIAVLLPTNAGLTTWQPVDRAWSPVSASSSRWPAGGTRRSGRSRAWTGWSCATSSSPARCTWAQVVDVEFGGGEPWVTLELDDTDTVAVMAIQRADGAAAMAEAQRLAGLVRDLGEAR